MNVVPMISETLPSQGSTLEQLPLSVTVRVVEDLEAWTALRQQWNDLNENSVYPNVFSTWEWLTEWWKCFGGSKRLHIVLVEANSYLVGIVPLYATTRNHWSFSLRPMLRFVGNGASVCPEYLGPIVHRDYIAEVCLKLKDYFLQEFDKWSELLFEEFAADDIGTNRLIKLLCAERPCVCPTGETRLYISLPESYDAYLMTLSGHNRQKKRNRLRQACNKQNALLEKMNVDQIDEWFPIIQELTAKGRARNGERSSFENPLYTKFHTELLKKLMPLGQAEILLLTLENKPSAFWYLLNLGGKCYAYQSAADASQLGSPGDVALQLAIQHAIAERFTEFDFLRGNHTYKRSYTSTARETSTVHLYRTHGFRYLMRLSVDKVARPTKRWAQRLLKAI